MFTAGQTVGIRSPPNHLRVKVYHISQHHAHIPAGFIGSDISKSTITNWYKGHPCVSTKRGWRENKRAKECKKIIVGLEETRKELFSGWNA